MNEIEFEFPEDKAFFEKLLCSDDQSIEKYMKLFDFRDPILKRREFNSKRNTLITWLIENQGRYCALHFENICDMNSGYNVDHIIPLSTNKLNKKIRNLTPEKGKKVKTQSFGSNRIENLILTCRNCNNHKKHRILGADKIKELLDNTSNPSEQK